MSNLTDYLSDLEELKEEKTKEAIIHEDAVVNEILEKYVQWLRSCEYTDPNCDHPISYVNQLNFDYAEKSTAKLEISSKTISKFSLTLDKYQHFRHFYDTGIFLSALINNSPDKEFEIIAPSGLIYCVGFKNKKKILVFGNLGGETGKEMKSGEILIMGNAEGWCTGEDMTGGIIQANFMGEITGHHQQGGKLTANKIKSISDEWNGGEIYENGKRLMPV